MRLLAALLIAFALPVAAQPAPPQKQPIPEPKAPVKPEKPFTRENVQAVVASHLDQIQECYEDAMAEHGQTAKTAPRGRVVVAWDITTDGLTADVRIKRNDIRDQLVTDCMIQAIRFWEFPKPASRQPVEFPFDLSPKSGGKGSK